MLKTKSLTELRSIAQSFGVADIFSKDVMQLLQAIEIKQQDLLPPPAVVVPAPQYDSRLMTKPPAKKSDEDLIREYAEPYIACGMKLEITQEQWKISCGKKNDQGTLRMPPRVFLKCCAQVMA